MKLYVIRHGETEENVNRIIMGQSHGKLTKKGLAHARKNAQLLKDLTFDFIYTSDLLRCTDTAEEIKNFHQNTPLIKKKELREINLGLLQGLKNDEIDWDKELGKDRQNGKPKGGESIYEVRQRVEKFIKYLFNKHHDKNILLVTHAGLIRQIISITTNIPSKQVFDTIPIHHDKVYEFEFYSDREGKWLIH